MWAASSENAPSSMRKICRFRSFCTCAKSHPGICSLLKHLIVSNDSVCRQQRPVCAGWSGPSLSVYAWKQVFGWHGPWCDTSGKATIYDVWSWVWYHSTEKNELKKPTQQAHNIKMTSYQRRCDVITSHRRWYDVILKLCAHWVYSCSVPWKLLHFFYSKRGLFYFYMVCLDRWLNKTMKNLSVLLLSLSIRNGIASCKQGPFWQIQT